jgi:hypothetical protein
MTSRIYRSDECRQSERGQPWANGDGYGLISNEFYESITIKAFHILYSKQPFKYHFDLNYGESQ